MNVYNSCDIVEYVRAVSKALTSFSGFSNQLVNLVYRFFSHDDSVNYYNMSVAIANDDVKGAGEAMGIFLGKFLMADIPETTETPAYDTVGNSIPYI